MSIRNFQKSRILFVNFNLQLGSFTRHKNEQMLFFTRDFFARWFQQAMKFKIVKYVSLSNVGNGQTSIKNNWKTVVRILNGFFFLLFLLKRVVSA